MKRVASLNSPVPPGILRKQGSLSLSAANSPASSPRSNSHVHFELPKDLAGMIKRYQVKQAAGRMDSMEELEGTITHLKNQRGASLVKWLGVLQDNIALLTPDLEKFVVEVLKINWAAQEELEAVETFQGFLTNLVTAHSFYIKHVAFMLVSHLVGRRPEEPEADQRVFSHVKEALTNLLKFAPLSSSVVLGYAAERMPYILIR